jgi:hypothetical protein
MFICRINFRANPASFATAGDWQKLEGLDVSAEKKAVIVGCWGM